MIRAPLLQHGEYPFGTSMQPTSGLTLSIGRIRGRAPTIFAGIEIAHNPPPLATSRSIWVGLGCPIYVGVGVRVGTSVLVGAPPMATRVVAIRRLFTYRPRGETASSGVSGLEKPSSPFFHDRALDGEAGVGYGLLRAVQVLCSLECPDGAVGKV